MKNLARLYSEENQGVEPWIWEEYKKPAPKWYSKEGRWAYHLEVNNHLYFIAKYEWVAERYGEYKGFDSKEAVFAFLKEHKGFELLMESSGVYKDPELRRYWDD